MRHEMEEARLQTNVGPRKKVQESFIRIYNFDGLFAVFVTRPIPSRKLVLSSPCCQSLGLHTLKVYAKVHQ